MVLLLSGDDHCCDYCCRSHSHVCYCQGYIFMVMVIDRDMLMVVMVTIIRRGGLLVNIHRDEVEVNIHRNH